MNSTVTAQRIEATLQQDGSLTLENLPFRAGQRVEVIVLPRENPAQAGNPYPLRGTPFQYERPFDPVDQDDWEAEQ